jgi:hypothetical protein
MCLLHYLCDYSTQKTETYIYCSSQSASTTKHICSTHFLIKVLVLVLVLHNYGIEMSILFYSFIYLAQYGLACQKILIVKTLEVESNIFASI